MRRRVKSLILPLALLLAGTSLAAQLPGDDLTAELDALAAEENGEPEAAAAEAQAEEAREEEPAVDEASDAREEDGEAQSDLAAKLASLAAGGNGEAAYHLGMMHLLGLEGVAKNPQKAFDLFSQAAEAGDPLGAYRLGDYYDGEGQGVVEPDPALALRYKREAADAGYAVAQENVARLLYEAGETDAALDYLTASAKQGYQPALQALASLYGGEGKVPKNPVKVYAYVALLQAAAGGEPSKRLQAWRDRMQAELSEGQLAEAVKIVSDWKAAPSDLTRKALAGEAAARTLAGIADEPAYIPADDKEAEQGR